MINSSDENDYKRVFKNNSYVNYVMINEDDSKNLSSSGNRFFINRHIREYYYFFDNLSEHSGNIIEPLMLRLDLSINGLLRDV